MYTRNESADVSVMSLCLTVTTFNCKSINEASIKIRTPHATGSVNITVCNCSTKTFCNSRR